MQMVGLYHLEEHTKVVVTKVDEQGFVTLNLKKKRILSQILQQ